MVASDVPAHNFFRRLLCPRTTVVRTCFYPLTGTATSSPPCYTSYPWRGSPVSTPGRGPPEALARASARRFPQITPASTRHSPCRPRTAFSRHTGLGKRVPLDLRGGHRPPHPGGQDRPQDRQPSAGDACLLLPDDLLLPPDGLGLEANRLLLLADGLLVGRFGAGIHGSLGRQVSDTLVIGPMAATNPVLWDFDLHLPGGGILYS